MDAGATEGQVRASGRTLSGGRGQGSTASLQSRGQLSTIVYHQPQTSGGGGTITGHCHL